MRFVFTWIQYIFVHRLQYIYTFNKIWTLIQGLLLWKVWLELNNKIFNNNKWPIDYVLNKIW